MEEVIRARGHPAVSAAHASTLEVTTDDYLTEAGDCIIGIHADRAPADFDPAFVEACRDESATIRATIEVGPVRERIHGRGDPSLAFVSDRAAVIRTSDYVDDRTVLLGADAAASDIDRGIVDRLADGGELTLTLTVSP